MNPLAVSLQVRALCLGALAAIVVQLLFLMPPPAAVDLAARFWDKLLHFGAFALMASLAWIGAGGRRPMLVWLAIVAVGAADEARQVVAPERTADVADLFADAMGAACAMLVLNTLARFTGEPACVES